MWQSSLLIFNDLDDENTQTVSRDEQTVSRDEQTAFRDEQTASTDEHIASRRDEHTASKDEQTASTDEQTASNLKSPKVQNACALFQYIIKKVGPRPADDTVSKVVCC